MVGTALGHYVVETELGAGGMGVVYRARDTRLGRLVAIKVLSQSCQEDPERLGRFEREARLLASLNHANIAVIHGIESVGTATFLVLEYVPGETLAQRLTRGAVPLKEALAVARQVAEALEMAHGNGIIHRDLKPANIKLTPEGQVKVLDFGLAKAFDPAPRTEPALAETFTAAADLTHHGLVMGTVGYMSPEQASGRPVDQRSDLWAFGCVLYELLTAKRTFPGSNTTEVLVGVLDREPDWTVLPAGTPDSVRHLLRRCLTKDPRNRLHHAADARLELEDTLTGRVLTASSAQPLRRTTHWVLAATAAGLVLGSVAAAVLIRPHATAARDTRVVHLTIDVPEGRQIAPSWRSADIAFSPDAKTLLYGVTLPAPTVVYARRLHEADGGPLAVAKDLAQPMYSPDGRWVAMTDYTLGSLVKVPLSGGAPVPLAPIDMTFAGVWAPDGYIYWSNSLISGIVRTPENGGNTEPVTTVDTEAGERNHRFASLLGDRAVMFTVASEHTESYDDAEIEGFEFATKRRKKLVRGGTYARYSPSGHIVYARNGSLYAAAVDTKRIEIVGAPVKVLDGVLMSRNIGKAFYDISSAGDLAYALGPSENGERTLHWVDRHGRESAALPVPPRSYLNPRISPDGTSLALEIEGPSHDLYVFDFRREVLSRLSHDGRSHAPLWSPDAKRLAFRTWNAGMMTLAWMPTDRSSVGERLVNYTAWQSAASFSPDGQHLAFDQMDGSRRNSSVWILPMTGDRQPRQFISSGGAAKFSPDGRWVVYCSLESGRPEIYVQAWPGPGLKQQISSDGGVDPVWSRDGREIFYRSGSKMMVIPVSTAPNFRAEKPRMLWSGDYMLGLSSSCGLRGVTFTSYDVSPDGSRFLMIKDKDQQMYATKVRVVINWVEELKRIMAAAANGPG